MLNPKNTVIKDNSKRNRPQKLKKILSSSDHEALLTNNHLAGIHILDNSFTLFEVLSYLIFNTKEYSEHIYYITVSQLNSFYQNKNFPFELEFIAKEETFMQYFVQNRDVQSFNALYIFLFAYFIDKTIQVVFSSSDNMNLFANSLNPGKTYTFLLYVFESEFNNINYVALKRLFEDESHMEAYAKNIKEIKEKICKFNINNSIKVIDQYKSIRTAVVKVHKITEKESSVNEDIYFNRRYKCLFEKYFSLFFNVKNAQRNLEKDKVN